LNLKKIEIYTTETVCDRFFSETTERNLLKLGSYYGHNMQMCIIIGNSHPIIFLGVIPP
jgi:hypothetical protein